MVNRIFSIHKIALDASNVLQIVFSHSIFERLLLDIKNYHEPLPHNPGSGHPRPKDGAPTKDTQSRERARMARRRTPTRSIHLLIRNRLPYVPSVGTSTRAIVVSELVRLWSIYSSISLQRLRAVAIFLRGYNISISLLYIWNIDCCKPKFFSQYKTAVS